MVSLLLKWVKGLFTHPINIIKGNWFRCTNNNEVLYRIRYPKCYNCVHRQDSPIGEICGECGCPLDAKLRVKDEKCVIGLW